MARPRSWAAGLFMLAGGLLLTAAACLFSPPGSGTTPAVGGPEYSALVVSSDLAAGANRLVFALVTRDGAPVAAQEARVVPKYTPPGAAEAQGRPPVSARFLPWPPEGSNRGVFVANLELEPPGEATADNPGLWELDITAAGSEGVAIATSATLRVARTATTPAIGDPAPASVTPTAGAAADLSTISSAPEPDPELYRLSVHEALKSGKPLMLLFSTPAFCVSATCGPQLEILGRLKDRYGEQANFIHVEVFADPHLIQGNRLSARQAPAVAEWGLPSEPWTFLVDRQGRISAKFEQFTPETELEAALQKVL